MGSRRLKIAKPGEPVEQDITVFRNDTFMFKFRGFDNNGNPYDFTNHTFKLVVVEQREEGATKILEVTDSSFTIDQDSLGAEHNVENLVRLQHGESNMDIEPGDYVYDLEMTDPNGIVQTIFVEEDYFRVKQDAG